MTSRPRYAKPSYVPNPPDNLTRIRTMWRAGFSVAAIAIQINMTRDQVKNALIRLKLARQIPTTANTAAATERAAYGEQSGP